MKKVLTLVFILLLMSSCRSLTNKGRSVNSAEKYVKSGNYYEAVMEFTNALMNDPDYKPAIEGLNATYGEAITKQRDKTANLKVNGSLIDYANEVEKIVLLYKNVSRLRPETFVLLNFRIEPNDVKQWTSEASKAYYEAGKNYTPRQTTFDYKIISKLYKKSYDYNPKYADVFDKYKESRELAMQKVVYFEIKKEYNYFNVGNLLNSKIFGLISGDSEINQFTSFINGDNLNLDKKNLLSKNFTEEELKEKNYLLDLDISNINFIKPKIITNYTSKKWYEVKKNVNGVIKTEVILYMPKTQETGATYTEKKYTEISNNKEISVKMSFNYNLIDLRTKASVKQGIITEEFKDSHTAVIYIGDVNPNEKPIPDRELMSDFNMIEKVSEKVADKFKNELKTILQ